MCGVIFTVNDFDLWDNFLCFRCRKQEPTDLSTLGKIWQIIYSINRQFFLMSILSSRPIKLDLVGNLVVNQDYCIKSHARCCLQPCFNLGKSMF